MNALVSPEFASFVRSLRGDFKIPCKATIKKRVNTCFEECQVRVAEELGTWGVCSLAMDGWKDQEGQETLGATALSIKGDKPLVLFVEQQESRQVASCMRQKNPPFF